MPALMVGHQSQHDAVTDRRDLQLGLADADGLDHDDVTPVGIEQVNRLPGGRGQPTQVTARTHAADKDALVEGVPRHPDAVPEDSTAGKGAARVHGDHAHSFLAVTDHLDQRIGQGALAGAGRAG